MSKTSALSGKVAVITGGARGLGRSVSMAFAAADADIAAISRTHEDLNNLYHRVKTLGRNAVTHCGDISRENDVNEFIEDVVRKFGRVDFLVNNAALYLEKNVDETTADEWRHIIDVNLMGTFLVTRAVVPHMKKQRSGHIFTISSVGGRMGLAGKSAYCASKYGVTGFSKAIGKELREYGVKVQIVYPYYVDSYGENEPTERKREQLNAVSADDLANMIVYHAALPLDMLVEDIILDPFRK